MSRIGWRLGRGFAVVAALVYFASSVLAPWSTGCYAPGGWLEGLRRTVSGSCQGGPVDNLGLAAVILCYALIALALLAPRRSPLSLDRLRTPLALALLGLTLFELLERLPGSDSPPFVGRFDLTGFRYLGYGAWMALGSSIALLIASLVLDREPSPARSAQPERSVSDSDSNAAGPASAPATQSPRRLMRLVIGATFIYLLSVPVSWWTYRAPSINRYSTPAEIMRSISSHSFPGLFGWGEDCEIAAIAMLTVALIATRAGKTSFVGVRSLLALAVVLFASLHAYEVWHDVGTFYVWRSPTDSMPDYGMYLALASALVVLYSALRLDRVTWRSRREQTQLSSPMSDAERSA
jgi:hypothetical protein